VEWVARGGRRDCAAAGQVGNARHARDRRPATGPINRLLIDECDLLLGMFWTKLGTSTGVAASGTVEEIDRIVASHRPAMLYFSRRPIDPMKIDHAQHARLREFQNETYQNGVVARIRRGLAFGQEEAVEGWFVKVPSGFPSDAEQAQRRSPASFREDEIQGQKLGFL